jgi:putative FmdB family regulatory protein
LQAGGSPAGFFIAACLLKSVQKHHILEVSRVPLYEYQCKKCKHRFEKIQKFSDSPIKKCPECGGAVEKLLHAPAVQFKGTGWYVTDYAGKQPAAESAADKASDKKEEKPAAKDKDKGQEHKPKKTEAKKTKE